MSEKFRGIEEFTRKRAPQDPLKLIRISHDTICLSDGPDNGVLLSVSDVRELQRWLAQITPAE